MSSTISFILNNKLTTIDFNSDNLFTPTTTLLHYLRSLPNHKGTKEGCAVGDCGACTVVIAELTVAGNLIYKSVNSCLIFLPMIHGKQIITVEDLKSSDGYLHPVQKALVELNGIQCGFCTPGIVMSLFALYKNLHKPSIDQIKEYLNGNLCRCTGYQSILKAAKKILQQKRTDHFSKSADQIKSLLSQISQNNFSFQKKSYSYLRPVTLNEALRLKEKFPNASLINGGTDLALSVTKDRNDLDEFIDLSNISTLKGIHYSNSKLIIKAGTTLQDIKQFLKAKFPALYEMFSVFGSIQIRNLSTLGGNLGSASPVGDSAPLLMAYGASVKLRSLSGTRTVYLDDFITGYRKTVCRADEIITAIEIPFPHPNSVVSFYKFSKRRDVDIATVSAGFMIQLNDSGQIKKIILAFGGMAEVTKRATALERKLIGRFWKRKVVEECFPVLEEIFTPLSDARADNKGRLLAAQNLLLKFWQESSGVNKNV